MNVETAVESQAATAPPPYQDAAARTRTVKRKRLLLILAAVVAGAALIYTIWYLLVGSKRVSTDNAYVNADVAQVTPRVDGTVLQVLVADTQMVKRGQVLVTLDDADAHLAVAEAEAELDRAIRRVRQTNAQGDALAARVAERSADIQRARAQRAQAQSALQRARIDLQRRSALVSSGAVSGEELSSARNAYAEAQAAVAASDAALAQTQSARVSATGELAANEALWRGIPLENNPEILAARARVGRVRLNFDRTILRAPVDGIVSKRQVQVGQRVEAGSSLMVIVPISQVYVDANFKEVQLAKVRRGQPARLTSDLYGDGVVYHGRVVGFSGGTGSAFALIPAQNATGNWIKVVQRVPVRISLDPRELAKHPLRVGLSIEATVDISGKGER